jgi:hypothetical protein
MHRIIAKAPEAAQQASWEEGSFPEADDREDERAGSSALEHFTGHGH